MTNTEPKLGSNPHAELVQFMDRLTDAAGCIGGGIHELNKARGLAVSGREMRGIDLAMESACVALGIIAELEERA